MDYEIPLGLNIGYVHSMWIGSGVDDGLGSGCSISDVGTVAAACSGQEIEGAIYCGVLFGLDSYGVPGASHLLDVYGIAMHACTKPFAACICGELFQTAINVISIITL